MMQGLPSADGLPTSYDVGSVHISPNVVLAPMEGVTDLAFRRIVRSIGGPGLTYTEFIASKGLTRGEKRVWRMAQFDPDERPLSLQIYGRDPEMMAEAAILLQDAGATIIDINMGCPSKKVCKNSGGSALMKDLDHAIEIVKAVRKVTKVPLTVKMRSGFDAQTRNAPELCYRCQEEGVDALTIHWRTREDRYKGTRAVDKIAESVDRVSIPVIANGDVVDIPSANAMFRETGCAGVMIGRGAIQNPWLMTQVGQWLRGEPVMVPTPEDRYGLLLRYFAEMEATMDSPSPRGLLGRMKQVIKYFLLELPGGPEARKNILRTSTPAEALTELEVFFNGLINQPERPFATA